MPPTGGPDETGPEDGPGGEDLEGWIDPYGGPDEPDPDFFAAENARFHGDCGTCGGTGRIWGYDEADDEEGYDPYDESFETECFACRGSGRASNEAVCEVCHGTDRPRDCQACGGSGLRLRSPHGSWSSLTHPYD